MSCRSLSEMFRMLLTDSSTAGLATGVYYSMLICNNEPCLSYCDWCFLLRPFVRLGDGWFDVSELIFNWLQVSVLGVGILNHISIIYLRVLYWAIRFLSGRHRRDIAVVSWSECACHVMPVFYHDLSCEGRTVACCIIHLKSQLRNHLVPIDQCFSRLTVFLLSLLQ